jgi:hypothetical protein
MSAGLLRGADGMRLSGSRATSSAEATTAARGPTVLSTVCKALRM